MGQIMTQLVQAGRRLSPRASSAFVFIATLMVAPAILSGPASAQALGYASAPQSSFPSDNVMVAPPSDVGDASLLPEQLRRTEVALDTREAPGTVIIDTGNTALYYVLGQGRAIRYGVGVGREGFT
ncbi:MAG TPA: L,D-transpeptidase, partial [Xanthobacteraceae bacterium]|nr:L,D-transpeptidase [Xanthobacteraceae bacterium]